MELPAHPGAARLARDRIRARLRGVMPPARLQDTLLLATELVTNAVLHGAPPITMTIEVTGSPPIVRISVTDRHQQAPLLRDSDRGAIAGRGMSVVDSLASRWGVRRLPAGGKTIWFEMAGDAAADAAADASAGVGAAAAVAAGRGTEFDAGGRSRRR